MKKLLLRFSSLVVGAIVLMACNRTPSEVENNDWKLGVALYTFHTFSFPEALAKADSAGVEYVEGFTFGKAAGFVFDSNDVSAEVFSSDFEGNSGSGARFKEEIDDGFSLE